MLFKLGCGVCSMIVFIKKFISHWSSPHGSAVKNLTSIHDDAGLIPGLSQRSGIRNCHELWCRWQRRLGSLLAVAVAVAGSCSSDLTPSLRTYMCHRYSPEKQKKKKSSDQFYLGLYKLIFKYK